jgi:hypothetical protein
MKKRAPLSALAERNKPGGAVLWASIIVFILIGVFVVARANGPDASLIAVLAIVVIGLAALAVAWMVKAMRAPLYDENDRDYEGSKVIQAGLPAVMSEVPRSTLNIDTTQPEVSVYQGLQLGEVSRHFDSQTSASIEGWLNHNLQVSGRTVSYQLSRSVGEHYRAGMSVTGEHSAGITGQSSVHLTFTVTTRDNLLTAP